MILKQFFIVNIFLNFDFVFLKLSDTEIYFKKIVLLKNNEKYVFIIKKFATKSEIILFYILIFYFFLAITTSAILMYASGVIFAEESFSILDNIIINTNIYM